MGFNLSIHRSGEAQGQLERLIRDYHQLLKAQEQADETLRDDSYRHFFQNLLSTRDWIAKIYSDRGVFELFKNDVELGLGRDIANTTKHYSIDRRAAVDGEVSLAREYSPQHSGNTRIVVLADQKRDLLELAKNCLNKILDYCQRFGLSLPVIY